MPRTTGGGWVPLEMHDVCDGAGDPLLPPLAHCTAPGYVTRALFAQFLDWLKGEVDAGRVQVKTVHDVIGGPLRPEVAMRTRRRAAHGQSARQPVLRDREHKRSAV